MELCARLYTRRQYTLDTFELELCTWRLSYDNFTLEYLFVIYSSLVLSISLLKNIHLKEYHKHRLKTALEHIDILLKNSSFQALIIVEFNLY